jgi:hypothetical protein
MKKRLILNVSIKATSEPMVIENSFEEVISSDDYKDTLEDVMKDIKKEFITKYGFSAAEVVISDTWEDVNE